MKKSLVIIGLICVIPILPAFSQTYSEQVLNNPDEKQMCIDLKSVNLTNPLCQYMETVKVPEFQLPIIIISGTIGFVVIMSRLNRVNSII